MLVSALPWYLFREVLLSVASGMSDEMMDGIYMVFMRFLGWIYFGSGVQTYFELYYIESLATVSHFISQ